MTEARTHVIAVQFGWEPVAELVGNGGDLVWPGMPTGAGVYRFILRLGDRTRTYIGETDNYRRRFSHYARPGPTQSTNLKMKARLLRLLNEQGGRASIDVATGVTLLRNGVQVDAETLPDVYVRRLVENAALVELAAGGGEIINGRGFPSGEL